jgi:hypothetical protein
MVTKRRSPLFSAVVLAGAALTAAQACGSEDDASTSATNPGAQDGSSGQDAQESADAAVAEDSATAEDAAHEEDAASAGDGHASDAACPPDAEIPVPPCVLIK